jgi:hypothetical protein
LFSNLSDDQVGLSPGLTESDSLAQPPYQDAVAAADDDEDADEMLGASDRPSERDVVYIFLTFIPRSQLVNACEKWKVASYGRKYEIVPGVFEYSIRRIRISEKTKNSIRIRFVRIRIRIAISQFDSRELTLREFVHELFEEAFEYSVPIRGDSL